MRRLDLCFRSGCCRVEIGPAAEESLPRLAAELGPFDGIAVVIDQAVSARAKRIAARLGARVVVEFSGGERSKTLGEVERLAQALLRAAVPRRALLVGIGGGATTDASGFLASIYLRGIGCVLVPTSLLAMVDAAIGGKNGVDLAGVKNVLGTIVQPLAVVIDPSWLDTLPDPPFRDGMVEVIKMAAMLDLPLLNRLERDLERLLAREPQVVEPIVAAAAALKAGVVEQDERDASRRLLLNFGHTIGHALEALSDFTLSHGRAVAIGMVAESRLAGDGVTASRLARLLGRLSLPVDLPAGLDRDALWGFMTRDKKVAGGEVRLAVPSTSGDGRLITVRREDLERIGP